MNRAMTDEQKIRDAWERASSLAGSSGTTCHRNRGSQARCPDRLQRHASSGPADRGDQVQAAARSHRRRARGPDHGQAGRHRDRRGRDGDRVMGRRHLTEAEATRRAREVHGDRYEYPEGWYAGTTKATVASGLPGARAVRSAPLPSHAAGSWLPEVLGAGRSGSDDR